jgi:Tfp pilus assembly protein PilV
MPLRARKPASGEDGFIIIEVLVSALILAIVAGAVLTLISATTRSAASGRTHSTAYGLAQEDQARLRTLRISTLNGLAEPNTETIGGTTYTIESIGTFVNNSTGTVSCTESNASADYVQITSTVTAPTLQNPVSLQSIISPSSGSLDPSHGTISFQVNNALGTGVSGVAISGSGTGNFNGTTESGGCAVFADLPAGNYRVTATANGLITPEGTTTWEKEQVGAPASSTQQVSLRFDKAGTVKPAFVYKEPKTSALTAAPVDSMELYNSENEARTLTFGTPNLTTRSSTLEDAVVFPFKTKYAVYAGSCTTNNPDPESKSINAAAIASVAVTGGGTATPTIQIPALNLTVKDSGGTVVKGAKVILTDANCKYNGSNVKREYTTNKLGHIVSSAAELESVATEAVGLPFGTYNICVSAKIGTETRKVEATGSSAVTVNNLTTAVAKTMALPSSGSSSACS